MMTFNKETGPKPSKTILKEAQHLARPDTSTQMAIAMAMRPNGATQTEIVKALGHPHRNKIKHLLDTKKVKMQLLSENTRATRIKLIRR